MLLLIDMKINTFISTNFILTSIQKSLIISDNGTVTLLDT